MSIHYGVSWYFVVACKEIRRDDFMSADDGGVSRRRAIPGSRAGAADMTYCSDGQLFCETCRVAQVLDIFHAPLAKISAVSKFSAAK